MSGSNAAETAPAAEASEKPVVKRTRGGRNKKPEAERAQSVAEQTSAPVEIEVAAPVVVAPVIDEPPKVEAPKQEREQSDNRRGGRGRGRDNNNGNRNNRSPVVLAEGMPNFIAQSFIERLISEGKNPNAEADNPEGDEMPDPTVEIKNLAAKRAVDDSSDAVEV